MRDLRISEFDNVTDDTARQMLIGRITQFRNSAANKNACRVMIALLLDRYANSKHADARRSRLHLKQVSREFRVRSQ